MSPFKTLSSKIAWSSPWYRVQTNRIVLPNGEQTDYHVIRKSGAVWIVPVTDAGEIVLIRTYRYTVDDYCWEVPAGGIKKGQMPAEAAIAELKEEIGGTAKSWQKIGQFYTANGISDEVGHIFLAKGVTLGTPKHEPTEVIEIHPKPIAQVLQMMDNNEISDLTSVAAILKCRQFFKPCP